ncbi:Beta-catenin-like protein 1, partial [Perkinsus olseni]
MSVALPSLAASSSVEHFVSYVEAAPSCYRKGLSRLVEDLEAAVPVDWAESSSIRHNLAAYDLCAFVNSSGAKFDALWRLAGHVIPRLERGDMEQECWCVDNPMSFKTASEDGKIFVAAPLCNPLHRNFVRWFWRSGAATVVDRDIATDQLVIGKCGYLLSGGRLVRSPGEIIIFIATKACTRVECEHSSGRIFDIPLRPREAVMCMGNGMRVVEGAGIFCVLGWDYNWNVTSKCKVTCLEVRARIKGTPFDMDNGGISVIACPRCHRPNGLLVEPKELSRRRWINNVGKCLLVCVYSSEGERAIEKLGRDLEWYGPEYDRLLLVPRGCPEEGFGRGVVRYWPERKEVTGWVRHPHRYREESSRPREPAARDLTLPEGRVSRRCFNSDRYGTDCYTAVEALDIDGYDTVLLMEPWWRPGRPLRDIIEDIEVVPSVGADGGFMIFEPKKWQSKWLKDILTQAEHPAQQRWNRPLKGLLVSFWKTAALVEAPLSSPLTEGNQAAPQQQQQQPTGLGPTFNVTSNTGVPKGPSPATWFPAAGTAANTTSPGRPSPSDVAWKTIHVPVAGNLTTAPLPVDLDTTQQVTTTTPPVIVPGNVTINDTSTTTVEVPVVVPTASAIPVGKRDVYLANGFFFLAVLLGLSLLGGQFLKWARVRWLGESGLATTLGLLCGLLLYSLRAETMLEKVLELNEEVFFFVLLPPIIFQGGFCIDTKTLFKNFGTIVWLAVWATLCSFMFIAGAVFLAGQLELCSPWTIHEAMGFATVISATDPVAVLSVLKSLSTAGPLLWEDRSLVHALQTSIYVFACSCLLGTAFAFVSSLVYKFFPRDIGGSNGGYELESRRVASDEVE